MFLFILNVEYDNRLVVVIQTELKNESVVVGKIAGSRASYKNAYGFGKNL